MTDLRSTTTGTVHNTGATLSGNIIWDDSIRPPGQFVTGNTGVTLMGLTVNSNPVNGAAFRIHLVEVAVVDGVAVHTVIESEPFANMRIALAGSNMQDLQAKARAEAYYQMGRNNYPVADFLPVIELVGTY